MHLDAAHEVIEVYMTPRPQRCTLCPTSPRCTLPLVQHGAKAEYSPGRCATGEADYGLEADPLLTPSNMGPAPKFRPSMHHLQTPVDRAPPAGSGERGGALQPL
uniref:Uncharacterized protein n=1 Tax=Eutreptiella gymnastica TaxID=73025 RepID=A0A7S4G8Y0_9EUGL